MQLVRLRAASQGQVAEAFGVDPATIWRWDQAAASGLVPVRRGPKGASKLTPALAAWIMELNAAGQTLWQIAAATGVSTFTVRAALGQAPAAGGEAPAAGGEACKGSGPDQRDGEAAAADEPLPVLPDPVLRDGERALARWGLPGEGAEPVFAPVQSTNQQYADEARPGRRRPVLLDGTGIDELWAALERHAVYLNETGEIEGRRQQAFRHRVRQLALGKMERRLDTALRTAADGDSDPYAAADRIVADLGLR